MFILLIVICQPVSARRQKVRSGYSLRINHTLRQRPDIRSHAERQRDYLVSEHVRRIAFLDLVAERAQSGALVSDAEKVRRAENKRYRCAFRLFSEGVREPALFFIKNDDGAPVSGDAEVDAFVTHQQIVERLAVELGAIELGFAVEELLNKIQRERRALRDYDFTYSASTALGN